MILLDTLVLIRVHLFILITFTMRMILEVDFRIIIIGSARLLDFILMMPIDVEEDVDAEGVVSLVLVAVGVHHWNL